MESEGIKLLTHAEEKNYGICGFNVFNYESALAVIESCQESRSPVFLQIDVKSSQYFNLEYTILFKKLIKKTDVPICLHFDHGPEISNLDQLDECIELGFNSIMIDASKLPLNENIEMVKKFVSKAHKANINVESEIGVVSRNVKATADELHDLMTDPEEARLFTEATKIDYLAVSVGSVHGFGKSALNFNMIKEIKEKVKIPLVLHGGTGIPKNDLREAINLGIRKINIGHGFRKNYLDSLKKILARYPDEIDARKIHSLALNYFKNYIIDLFKVTGSYNRF